MTAQTPAQIHGIVHPVKEVVCQLQPPSGYNVGIIGDVPETHQVQKQRFDREP